MPDTTMKDKRVIYTGGRVPVSGTIICVETDKVKIHLDDGRVEWFDNDNHVELL